MTREIEIRLPLLSPFPTVADAVQAEVNDYKTSEEEVMRLKTVMVGGPLPAMTTL